MHRIRMGNDEFILYIRKNYTECQATNELLGRQIWIWLRDNADGQKGEANQLCSWGTTGEHIGERLLPKTATQFTFNAARLPDLYRFLDGLGSGISAE